MSSTTYISWAVETPLLPLSERAVLLLLAYYADQMKVCRPSINRLAEESGASRATVFRALNALEERGLIKREEGAKTTIYILQRGSHGETGGLTVRPEVAITTTSTYGTDNYYLHPSGEGRSRPKKKSSSSDTKAAGRGTKPPVRKGWGAAREVLASRRQAKPRRPIKHTPKPRAEVQPNEGREEVLVVSTFGMLDDEPPQKPQRKKSRPQVESADHLAAVGKLVDDRPKKPKVKPIENWMGTDFERYLSRKARVKAPRLRDQTQVGWARADFARWLREGTPPAAIKDLLDRFLDDDSNFLAGHLTVWQRFRKYFIAHQQEALSRLEIEAHHEQVSREAEQPAPRRTDPWEITMQARAKAEEEARKLAEAEAEAERIAAIELEELKASWGMK